MSFTGLYSRGIHNGTTTAMNARTPVRVNTGQAVGKSLEGWNVRKGIMSRQTHTKNAISSSTTRCKFATARDCRRSVSESMARRVA